MLIPTLVMGRLAAALLCAGISEVRTVLGTLDTYSRCQRCFKLEADGTAATPPTASVVLGTGLCGHIPDVCQQRTQRLALLMEHLHGGRCARPQQRTDPFAQPGRLPR